MKKKIYKYEGFQPTLEFAESLGWEDIYPNHGEPCHVCNSTYDESMCDFIEGQALAYIRAKGYWVNDDG